MDFSVPADHKVQMKESEWIDKYLDLAWELKLKKIKVMVSHVLGGTIESALNVPEKRCGGIGKIEFWFLEKKTSLNHSKKKLTMTNK